MVHNNASMLPSLCRHCLGLGLGWPTLSDPNGRLPVCTCGQAIIKVCPKNAQGQEGRMWRWLWLWMVWQGETDQSCPVPRPLERTQSPPGPPWIIFHPGPLWRVLLCNPSRGIDTVQVCPLWSRLPQHCVNTTRNLGKYYVSICVIVAFRDIWYFTQPPSFT